MNGFNYIGNELEIFAHAKCWKAYYKSLIEPYLGSRVLEVGAGAGATTAILCDQRSGEWVCLEPDSKLKAAIDARILEGSLPANCRTQLGTLEDLGPEETFDTILYIDVIEHIQDDCAELQRAAQHLRAGGVLIVLSPAHPWLFTPFDKAIGHYRRYTKKSMAGLSPNGCSIEKLVYLDSVGVLLSLANRLLLRQSMPTIRQIVFWDRWIVPLSQKLDPVLKYNLGKSVLGVWRCS